MALTLTKGRNEMKKREEFKELDQSEDFEDVLKAFDELSATKGQQAVVNLLKVFADIVGLCQDTDGLTLKLLQTRYGISQKALADKLGIEVTNLSKMQTEVYPVTPSVAKTVFEVFKLKLKRYGEKDIKNKHAGLLPTVEFPEK
jgi:hypothetical protein